MVDLSELQFAILLIVRDHAPIHGHAIRKEVPAYSEGRHTGSVSSTYESLHRLEERGFLKASETTSPEGRYRRNYRITALGSDAIAQYVRNVDSKLKLARKFNPA
jgi:DNA-binding PadR family transcriptional regulator